MNLINIIKYPILTEKSYKQMQENVYVFAVDRRATKYEIKNAVEFIFQVKVESVNTFNVPKKPKRVGRYSGFVAGYKKAIVKLVEGSIKILPEEGIAGDEKLKETDDSQVKAKVKEISEVEKRAAEKIKKMKEKENNKNKEKQSINKDDK